MRQFIGLALAFILLPVMLKVYPKVFKGKKAPLGPILMVTALIIGTIGGLPVLTMADSFKRVFTTFSTLQTLIVVVGGSSKGLGAAGIDADGELARLAELIDGAKSAGLSVIAMHTGGEARRGELSDKFITPIFEKADYAIVVAAGDEDGLMAGICANAGIPMDSIASISEVTTVLPAAFK